MLLRLNLRTRGILPRVARYVGATLLWLTPLLALALPGLAADASVIAIDFQIAYVDGKPVVEPAFIDERVARANEIFAPYSVKFVKGVVLPLAATHAALETAADRDALGANVRRAAINCFVVRSMRDVDDPAQMRRGVHWHSHTHAGAHYVILSTLGGPAVLAHELGHFLGNSSHSDVVGNLMSYQRLANVPPFLDAPQQRRMIRTIHGYLRSGELKAIRK